MIGSELLSPAIHATLRNNEKACFAMSIVGGRTAVVSLGSSCQPAQQLRRHARVVSEIIGDELAHTRLPFDWVISPIERTTEWLRSDNLFPTSPDKLTLLANSPGAFLWREMGVYFWHDFRTSDGNIDLIGTFEKTRAKYEARFTYWRNLRQLERVIVVVANTQNNIPRVLGTSYPTNGFDFTVQLLKDLKNTVDEVFERHVELLCVTCADRSSIDLQSMLDLNIVVSRIARDTSEWEGDSAEWTRVLLEYLQVPTQGQV